MSPNSSFIPPEPPFPPIAKAAMLVFSILMTLALTMFVGFILVEWTMDLTGHRSWIGVPAPMEEEPFSWESETTEELKSPFALIAPRDQTQIQGPEIAVIYTVRTMLTSLPDLLINDSPYPWDVQYGENTWFARIHLPEGLYRLRAGEAVADFFVVAPETAHNLPEHLPDFWKQHHPHPDTNVVHRCGDCHEMLGQPTDRFVVPRGGTINAWKGASSCFACHEMEEHEKVHRFVLPTTAQNSQCIRCHAIH